MTTEPVHEEISEDDQHPATHGDISSLRTEIEGVDQRLIGMESRLDRLQGRMDRLESGQKALLQVLTSMDQRLAQWKGLPERVTRLEEDVTRLTLRRR